MTQKTFNFTDERISLENLGDGRHVVKLTPGGTKILAYISDGKVTRYEAEDSMGNRQTLFSISLDMPDSRVVSTGFIPGTELCQVCVYEEAFDSVICYGVLECPPPMDIKQGPH
jgi:hypothetical protein